MQLKKLTILGFKSFAEKTTLHFNEGITCIVGPNGCGKSNIADAFRWVLGEQSAKSLRGSKMPDVIFAGTITRKPVNVAEVSLTLSNIKGSLPLDYEEVTITRRLHRNGESEYLLNNNAIRLKDLHTLFLDSGIGKNAFSIFEQGKLDQIIQFSPYERRIIFEEAAGILRFLQKKKEALKRLEESQGNLSRIQDLSDEIEKQISLLEKQAEKAHLFKQIQEELKNLEKESFCNRLSSLDKQLGLSLTQKQQQESALSLLQQTAPLKENEERKLRAELHLQEKELHVNKDAALVLQEKIKSEKRAYQTLEEQLTKTGLLKNKLFLENEELTKHQENQKTALSALEDETQLLQQAYSSAENQWTLHQNLVKEKEKEVVSSRQLVAEKQKNHLTLIQQCHKLESEMQQVDIRLEHQTDYQKQLDVKKRQFHAESKVALNLTQDKQKQLEQTSSAIDRSKGCLENIEHSLKELIKAIGILTQNEQVSKKNLLNLETRQAHLLKLQKEYEGFSSGSKRLLKEAADQKSPLYEKLKPFYTFFNVHKEKAEAIAIALKNYTQVLVAETNQDFELILDFALKNKIEDFALFCEEWTQFKGEKQPSSFAHELTDSSFTNYFLAETANTKDIHTLLHLWQGKEIVRGLSDEGFFIDSKGVLFKTSSSTNPIFLRESELKSLNQELKKVHVEYSELVQAIEEKEKRRLELQTERIDIDKALRKEEMTLVEINFILQRSLSDTQRIEKEIKKINIEENKCEEQTTTLKVSLESLKRQSISAALELDALKETEKTFSAQLEETEKSLKILIEHQQEKSNHYRKISTTRQDLLHESQLLKKTLENKENLQKKIQKELLEQQELETTLKNQITLCQKEIKQLEESLQTVETKKTLLETALEQQRAKTTLAFKAWKEKQTELQNTEQAVALITMQHEQLIESQKNLNKDLHERFATSPEDLKALFHNQTKPLEILEKEIRKARHSLQSIGDVNLIAIEALEEQSERFNFLQGQLSDMRVAKEALLELIHQLDRESKQIFKTTFEQIKINFQKNFQILFSGGEADLQLVDSDNILEAGIEISAKPPGKQMRSLSLLSGGEKCLTAVALLFAIFEVRPAPFCILDEIDAPLDDTNVERFLNVVKHFTKQCQFLIITHNKRTMAIGDTLFGISMEEKGISKLLSLTFAKDPLPEANLSPQYPLRDTFNVKTPL